MIHSLIATTKRKARQSLYTTSEIFTEYLPLHTLSKLRWCRIFFSASPHLFLATRIFAVSASDSSSLSATTLNVFLYYLILGISSPLTDDQAAAPSSKTKLFEGRVYRSACVNRAEPRRATVRRILRMLRQGIGIRTIVDLRYDSILPEEPSP